MRARYSARELSTLRVGDKVRIHIYIYGDDPKGEPFDAVLTKVEYEENFDTNGVGRPVIHWEPRPDIDFTKLLGEYTPAAYCDSSYVTDILERAPYKVAKTVTNELAASAEKFEAFGFAKRSRGYVAATPARVARLVLSKYPDLHIPYGFSEKKLEAEWVKAGRPGLKGLYDYHTQRVVAVNGADLTNGRAGTLLEAMRVTWISIPQFAKWLLRRVPHIVITKRVFRETMAERNMWGYDEYCDDDPRPMPQPDGNEASVYEDGAYQYY